MTIDLLMRWWLLGLLVLDALIFLAAAVNGPRIVIPLAAAGGILTGAGWLYFSSGLFP